MRKNLETAQADCNSQSGPTETPSAHAAKQRPRNVPLAALEHFKQFLNVNISPTIACNIMEQNIETAQAGKSQSGPTETPPAHAVKPRPPNATLAALEHFAPF